MSVIGSAAHWEMERRYSVAERGLPPPSLGMIPSTSEDLHAWSIYRQNLNSDFTDSALGSSEKSPLPYGNFQLRESTVQSILNHPRYGPKSALGSNMYTYLKFGLPRVFPPNGPRGKESSSYGSSEDGGSKRIRRPSTAYLRARSEADLTNIHYAPTVSGRGKSISQANLLSPDLLMNRQQASQRRSLADLRPHQMGRPASIAVPVGHPLNHHLHHMHHIHHVRPPSAMEPHEPFSFSMLHPHQYTGLYPHLQVRNLNMRSSTGEPLITNLSMEVKAGEILAIMSTKNGVASNLLDCISGRRRYSGQISVNGQVVTSAELRPRVAQVRSDTVLPPDLPVDNCLRYYAKLRQPPESRGKMPMGEQVRMVTEELGLSPVLETKVSHLTRSEYSRLLVAVQLLTDCQILCIDEITHSMDIFDTFFLVEFLRQWASGATGGVAGRVVVMSLQPPTYEILTMVSRLVILSGPEPMYHGPSRLLGQYFTSAEYPCPAYKNPADYYLDLVTLDDLSAEAMLESSQRVDQLTSLYKRRQGPLSDPQPYSLPSKFSTAGPFKQAYTLLLRDLMYSQPSSFCSWISRVLLSAFMSLVLGVIFWDVPASDPQLNREDRLGYHFAVLVVCSLPLALSMGLDKSHSKLSPSAESDISQGLYSRPLYILCTLLYSVIPSCLVWMAYLVPAYCMSGLYDQVSSDALTIYLGYSLTVLITVEYTVAMLGILVLLLGGGRGAAVVTNLLLMWLLGPLHSSFPLHSGDAPITSVLAVLSPLPSLYPSLVARDYDYDTLQRFNAHLVCRNKQVQHQDIIVHLPCPVPNGTAVLEWRGVQQLLPTSASNDLTPPYTTSLIILAVVSVVSLFVFSVKPICTRRKTSIR